MNAAMPQLDFKLKTHFDAHSLAADQLARQIGLEEQREISLYQIATEIADQTLTGDYSVIELYAIQEIEADTELYWDKVAELREAWFSGVRGDDLELLVASLMGVTRQVVMSIATNEAPEELAKRNSDTIISMREAS